MFFSVQHLVGPDAKFALVWRAATCGSTTKLPRKAILEVSVSNTCREILNFTPEAHDRVSAKKFSLYLLGQLLYGTVLIYDRQLTLFLSDARSAWESCRRLRQFLPKPSKGAPTSAKKGVRRARGESRVSGIDIVEQPEGRFVGLARRDEITMVESQPIIWKREDPFQEETVQAPVHVSRERFIEWDDQRTSSSKESMKTLAEVKKEPATLEAASVSHEVPPFPPPETFQNVERESILTGTQPVLDAEHGLRRGIVKIEPSVVVDAQPPSEYQPAPKKPRLDSGKPMTTSEENDREVPPLELPPLNDNLEVVQPSRRRKPLQSIDTNSLTISHVSMKEMQEDYSSLLKTPEELRINVDKHPTLHELLLPYPAYAGKRFPKACIGLYRSRYHDTITSKEAATENLFEPARGATTDSSKEGSDQRHTPGIAYALYPTPPRVCGAAALGNPSGDRAHNRDQSSVYSTPGMFKLLKTPERLGGPWVDVDQRDVARQKESEAGQGDVRRDSSALPGDLPLLPNIGELAADMTLSQNRLRESRPSHLELPRRLTGLTDEMGRRSSVLLRDSLQKEDTSQQTSQLSNISEKTLSFPICEVVDARELILLRAIVATDEPVPLSDIVPPATTPRKTAAAVFSTLLNLAKITVVEVSQDEAFGEIWVQTRTRPETSQHIRDALASITFLE
ncbi:unnamed protein product [Cylicocyclus nassatus]|uniref:Rad21/Rec8-like protein N-terminal domain-containing protein n=1 Tax=Cylicocyclus nassatus TaxID=53992 RepID=A0AA36MH35_CYLNA|nr:unnamed protein product [Cylicocyclus nassatus]